LEGFLTAKINSPTNAADSSAGDYALLMRNVGWEITSHLLRRSDVLVVVMVEPIKSAELPHSG
jgi:hypothetical protein